MEKKKLELEFLSEGRKKYTITVDDPKSDLTQEEVKTAMEAIIKDNIFTVSLANLAEAVEARIVTTSVEKLTE